MRVYNFSPGPSMLPEDVLLKAQSELLDYQGTGMSVMEMSHRSKEFTSIISDCELLLRELMGIPSNYKVLFMQGGATMQFSAVALNLGKTGNADYVDSGNFASNAIKEAKRFLHVNVVASSKEDKYAYIPEIKKENMNPDADYFHICYNNTIFGTRFTKLPDTGNVSIVADMSSCILSEPVDVSKFGMIYAGVQKNLSAPGMAIVIIREDLLENIPDNVPVMLDYRTYVNSDSLYNTPPSYSIYLAKLVLESLREKGGVDVMYKNNLKKADILYDFLDHSKLFSPTAKKEDRSLMNVTFVLPTDELNDKFVKEAAKSGLANLKGHRIIGGMRASIYNAMSVEGVQKLVDFMAEFEKNN